MERNLVIPTDPVEEKPEAEEDAKDTQPLTPVEE